MLLPGRLHGLEGDEAAANLASAGPGELYPKRPGQIANLKVVGSKDLPELPKALHSHLATNQRGVAVKVTINSTNDLGADAFVGEDFQEDGVGHAAIHERDFLHSRLDRGNGAIHFGDHSFVNDPALLQAIHLA